METKAPGRPRQDSRLAQSLLLGLCDIPEGQSEA